MNNGVLKGYRDSDVRSLYIVQLTVYGPSEVVATGNSQAIFRVPEKFDGLYLVGVAAHVSTVSSSGTPTVSITNITDNVSMLLVKLTIDASEKDSSTAAVPAVLDPTNDDLSTGDELAINVDVAGTGAQGLIVELQFA